LERGYNPNKIDAIDMFKEYGSPEKIVNFGAGQVKKSV
jgi:hypothetical protein